jgi:cytochrome c-type biogenesis protein CcmH
VGGNKAIFLGLITTLVASWSVADRAIAGDNASSSRSEHVAGARELEGRLIAPCCWTQTLDIHDSPIAEELRAEISKRLKAGERSGTIEDDLAARYGEGIRAVPRGEDPRVALPVIVGGSMALALVWLAWIGVVWLKRSRNGGSAAAVGGQDPRQQYDQQLDDELKHLSDIP